MAMQKLNVRFSDETKLKISKLAKDVGVSDSDLARSAMERGLFEINKDTVLVDIINGGDSHLQEDLLNEKGC